MVRQVISIHADGKMSGLQVKPGKGLDLRQFGRACIVRASEIVWCESQQAWRIVLQDAPGLEALKGCQVTYRAAARADERAGSRNVRDLLDSQAAAGLLLPGCIEQQDEPLAFRDYDDAVAVEIAYLDAWRVAGVY